MSLFCLCVVESIREKSEVALCARQLELIAKQYNRGVKFFADWSDPFVSDIQKQSFIMNITDGPSFSNCELFLLPDGWYYNGKTNKLPFRERMEFLKSVVSFFAEKKCVVDLYLGVSGICAQEFTHFTVSVNELMDCLVKTVGTHGAEESVHISITP